MKNIPDTKVTDMYELIERLKKQSSLLKTPIGLLIAALSQRTESNLNTLLHIKDNDLKFHLNGYMLTARSILSDYAQILFLVTLNFDEQDQYAAALFKDSLERNKILLKGLVNIDKKWQTELDDYNEACHAPTTYSNLIFTFESKNNNISGTSACFKKIIRKTQHESSRQRYEQAYVYWSTFSKAEHISLESLLMHSNKNITLCEDYYPQVLKHAYEMLLFSEEILKNH